MKVVVSAQGKTDIGQVRSVNQDSILVDTDNNLFIVADGMGGHAGGEIASRLCIEKTIQYMIGKEVAADGKSKITHPIPHLPEILGAAVNFASAKIYEKALEEPGLKGMGTTATIIKIIENYGYFAHVGDSRLYLIRSGFIFQLTHDHSLVSEQVRAGLLTEEEAEVHHLRNVITRSVGYQEEEDVDTSLIALEDGDLLVVCSDGLHGKLSNGEISQITKTDKLSSVDKLIAAANQRGGDDNISVIVIQIQVSDH